MLLVRVPFIWAHHSILLATGGLAGQTCPSHERHQEGLPVLMWVCAIQPCWLQEEWLEDFVSATMKEEGMVSDSDEEGSDAEKQEGGGKGDDDAVAPGANAKGSSRRQSFCAMDCMAGLPCLSSSTCLI